AQEDFLVRIERMGDQVQDLGDLCFESSGFGGGTHGQQPRLTDLPCSWGSQPRISTAGQAGLSAADKTVRPPCGGRTATRSTDAPRCSKTGMLQRGVAP